MTKTGSPTNHSDVVLVGAGIMSATLAVLLKELDPSLKIEIHEVLGSAAQESSNAWNNAGTGHAALMELNYTPEKSDGSIDISKALQVNTEFDLSRQLWTYLVKKGAIRDPQSFIHPVPHFSFVRGSENRAFLKKRFEALTKHPLYCAMEYSDDAKQIGKWIPLVMEGRDPSEVVTVIASDHSLVAMLGASPGASTAAWIMLQVIERSFAEELRTSGWVAKLREIIPSYGQSLIDNPALCERVRADTAAVLHINTLKQAGQNSPSRNHGCP
jgi:L-2-hydroxyglutarate oxidase LhgO